ncbi:hypothetical protein DW192_04465 [Segatella copri]|uniref:Uncharacterized protein n=1 Tax=Segatella copri TaxID=165179 RepID=A0A414YCN6_9BACT|nr:hypothetical protein DW192_04465 [Segatella copri]
MSAKLRKILGNQSFWGRFLGKIFSLMQKIFFLMQKIFFLMQKIFFLMQKKFLFFPSRAYLIICI